jgi:hypothetical protein
MGREFRGEAQVRRDVDVSDAEIAASNLNEEWQLGPGRK